MEELQMSLEKESNERRRPKPSKKTRRWTLLFIGEHGKIIPITGVKPMLILSALVLFFAVTAAASLYFINKAKVKENRQLIDALTASRRQIEALRHEKDILTARLVLTEPETEKAQGEITEKRPDKPSKTADDAGASTASVQPEEEPVNVAPDVPAQEVQSGRVDVDSFKTSLEPYSNTLNVEFALKKIGSDSDSISGYAFVVLKNTESNQDQWLTFPSANFVSGRPSPVKRGQYFSIARFKWMKFEIDNPADIRRYEFATVFVFASEGALLMKKDFPISM
ncbi:hypothetical protein ACFL03_09105 [Thermodesulfobacteriota bacterium]